MLKRSSPLPLPLLACCALLAGAGIPADAQLLYWGGAGGDVATAGVGNWDLNTSIVWRDNSPTGTLVKWTNNRTAIFQGTGGGAVNVASNLTIAAMQFPATAAAFTFSGTGSMNFNGAGISSESLNDQTFNFPQTTMDFSGSASAGAGAQGARIRMTIGGIANFSDTSTAGAATIVNNGEMHFLNQASAGTSVLTNTSLLVFEGNATSGAAAITNQSLLLFQENAHDFSAASVVNGTGGLLDLTGVTTVGGVLFGAFTASADSQLVLGTKRLAVANLNLTDGSELGFDLGASATGNIVVTGSVLGNSTAGALRISIYDTGGLVAGQSFTLIDWTGAASVLGVQSTDFALQPLPGGFEGSLKLDGSKLVLEVLPEPGSLTTLLLGAAGLAGCRWRRAAR